MDEYLHSLFAVLLSLYLLSCLRRLSLFCSGLSFRSLGSPALVALRPIHQSVQTCIVPRFPRPESTTQPYTDGVQQAGRTAPFCSGGIEILAVLPRSVPSIAEREFLA